MEFAQKTQGPCDWPRGTPRTPPQWGHLTHAEIVGEAGAGWTA